MTNTALMRAEKLKGNGCILHAARHNRRTLPARSDLRGSIDSGRSHLNETLFGEATPERIAEQAKRRLDVKPGQRNIRKDAVLCIEVIFSLPVDHKIDDDREYFDQCWRWAAAEFGGLENVLSVDVHRDEAAPHCHVLILPLLDGRPRAAEMLGYRSKFLDRQNRFHREVASKFGLAGPPEKISGQQRHEASRAILKKLGELQDPALTSVVWPAIRQQMEADPLPFLLLLKLPTPNRRMRTMAQIFTSRGKGPKNEPNRTEPKTIEFSRPTH